MGNNKECIDKTGETCRYNFLAVSDAMDLLKGKWKIQILVGLSYGSMQFGELRRTVKGIGTKMLARELQELELNNLVSRTENTANKPVTVTYALTPYAKSLDSVIQEILNWGLNHRKVVTGKEVG